jgi:hypothetical protein
MKSCCKEVFENDADESPKPHKSSKALLIGICVAAMVFVILKTVFG